MIIVLKGADFSANNIGRIDLPLVWDADAKIYFESLDNHEDFTLQQQMAINNLFKVLKSNGIYSSINNMYFPIFGRVDGGKNIKNPSQNANLPTTGATYDENGMLLSLGWRYSNNVVNRDHTIGVYNTTPSVIVTAGQANVSAAIDASSRILGRRIANNNTDCGYIASSTARVTIPNRASGIGLLAGGQSELNNKTSCFADSESGVDSIFGGSSDSESRVIGGLTSGASVSLLNASIGVIFDSKYLPNDKVSIVASLLDKVIESFK